MTRRGQVPALKGAEAPDRVFAREVNYFFFVSRTTLWQ